MRLFCWIFILSVACVSPVFLDLYPFSVFPMFSDNTSEYVVIEVRDADGNELRASQYGLHKLVLANREQRYGFDPGPRYFREYETITPQQVNEFLAENFPRKKYPIVVRHWTRGFHSSTRTIKDLTQPQQFQIDGTNFASDSVKSKKPDNKPIGAIQ